MSDIQQLYNAVDSDQNLYSDWNREDSLRARPLFTVLWLVMLAVVVVMALRMIPNGFDGRKYIPVAVAFMPWMAGIAAIVLLCALVGRRRGLAAVCVVCCAIQVGWHWGYLRPADGAVADLPDTGTLTVNTGDRYARLMTLNTKNGLADADQIVRAVREEHVEVLALQEVQGTLLQRLERAGLTGLLPYSEIASVTNHDNGGVNALFTAAPMSSRTANLLPIESSNIPSGCVRFNLRTVCFSSVHPFSPRPRNQGLWNSSLDSISKLQSNTRLFVLLGDFNATWDHASFRSLLGSRFVDAGERNGAWFHMTYPSNAMLFGGRIAVPPLVEIDHIVHDRSITVGDLETLDIAGSDHRALLGTLDVGR